MPAGPGFTLTFLYYFVSSALLGTFAASQALGIGLSTRIPFQIGVVLGVIVGGVGAYFNRSVTIELPIQGRKQFINRLSQILIQMGFEPQAEPELGPIAEPETELEAKPEAKETDLDGITIYEKSILGTLLSGSVYVKLGSETATVMSRAATIRRLEKVLKPD
jgi:hypothetical protein